jgi:hypothetical protein
VKQLDDSSSAGISGIPVAVLKATINYTASFVSKLFNNCISQQSFPDEFKFAIVSPLFKNKGSPHDLNNYRGISVLPPLCKVFEKILADQLRIYFSINKLFYAGQHSFRQFHSCESALHEVISESLSNMDRKLVNLLLFIDFKKAFDLINPDLLLIKLLNNGLTNEAVSLLRNYFYKRKQAVKINNAVSESLEINLGVPQGSVLGPFLFLIYINDLPFFLSSIRSKLFADDTTLMFAGDNIEDVRSKCVDGVLFLQTWCEYNYVFINWSKTYAMIISNKRFALARNTFRSTQLMLKSLISLNS